ncbi:transglycosylase domain-containing protein [Bradyrhizobium barranii]|uniref:transglycosylase domain-containing protein n=1 Tax=Bradyrhizobium TaxID=374 RepID=UPI003F24D679
MCLPDCRAGQTSSCATYISIGLKELPDVLIKATLATEDHRFYSHFGNDPAAIARSFHANWNLDGIHSTVSQQVARIQNPFKWSRCRGQNSRGTCRDLARTAAHQG